MPKLGEQFTEEQYFSSIQEQFSYQLDPISSRIFQMMNQHIEQTEQVIKSDILKGQAEFSDQSDKVQNLIKVPTYKKIGKDVNSIEKEIEQSENLLKKAKRDLLLQKKQELQAKRLQNQMKTKENSNKIKLWAEQQKVFEERRQFLLKQKQQAVEEEEQRQRQESEEKKQREIQERRRALEEKHRKLQEERARREQLYEQSKNQTKNIKFPRFKEIEKKFSKIQQQEQEQKQKLFRQKSVHLLDHEAIRNHEKNYLQKVYERVKQRGYSTEKSAVSQYSVQENDFKNLLKRSDEEVEREKEKAKRRQDFQNRLAEIPVNIDEDKKVKVQIAQDKAKNPFKYHFLGQKSLNDYQIFMEFKEFNMDINANTLGQSYMKEANEICRESRIKKSNSASQIKKNSSNPQKKAFKSKDYLQDLKLHRVSNENLQNSGRDSHYRSANSDVEHILRKHRSKSRAIEELAHQSVKMDHSIKDKKSELIKYNTITSTIRKEREIDEMYMKSIRAKLACLELK